MKEPPQSPENSTPFFNKQSPGLNYEDGDRYW